MAIERREVWIWHDPEVELKGTLWLPSDQEAALRMLRTSEVLGLEPGDLVELDGDAYALTPGGFVEQHR